jgi:hypothetical protein
MKASLENRGLVEQDGITRVYLSKEINRTTFQSERQDTLDM